MRFLEACVEAMRSEFEKSGGAQLRAREFAELTEMIAAWRKLTPELRKACLAVTASAIRRRE